MGSQSLGFDIFPKTSGQFCTFFGAYAKGQKLEGTRVVQSRIKLYSRIILE